MAQVTKITGLASAIRGCNSWQDIQIKWQEYSEDLKGYFFEELVKAYLQIDCEYASKLKHVWHGREVPLAIAKKLKLPVLDKGIDIVAETHDGAFWAIQCKYRQHTDQSLTWKELSTFTGLAFGVCRGISFGIVCSTTERYTHVLKKQEHIGFCALDVWQSLDSEFFKRLRAHLAHKPEILKPLRPRPHQKIALEDGHAHFVTAKAKRGKLVMPCGSGKSLTAYFLAEKLEARRIVIAVPSLALIRQTLKVWLRETQANGQPVEWICVCSDESAGRVDQDDAAVLRQDLGVPCLTDTDEIARWLKRKHAGLTIVFTTYQSGEALAQAARSIKFSFDLGIMDEAHKTVGDRSKLFSHLLHDENLPIRRRLFMTATERRYAGQSDTVLSMDDPAIYGETFHLLSFKRAMEYNPPILSDYKIISMSVSRAEIAALIRENTFVRPDKGPWNEEIEADMLASLIALRKAMEKYPIRHAVSFHGSIQRAELFKTHNDAFSKSFRSYGKLETFHVSGKTPTGTRARVIGEFANAERALVTNARCLTEGVDVPGIDCVLFADPRRSTVDIVQAVGRALRPAPGKQFGYVIVPILHDADATADDIFKSPAFKEILTTLRALAANDDRIIEYFRGVSQGRQRKGSGSVQFDIDERLAKRIDLADFAREIELKCWDKLAKLSWRPFEEARAFARNLRFRGEAEWFEFCKGNLPEMGSLPLDIPTSPRRVYAEKGWLGMGDWLGTGTIAAQFRKFRSFEQARAFARRLSLVGHTEWVEFCKGNLPEKGSMPVDIPSNPNKTYANDGWFGYGDWLGTGKIGPLQRRYRSFKDAQTFARGLGLRSGAEWNAFCRGRIQECGSLPLDIPANPRKTYANEGWAGMGDWLDTGNVANYLKQYRSIEEARAFVQTLGLTNADEWRDYCKGKMPTKTPLPKDIPSCPHKAYRDLGWQGIRHWLGIENVSRTFGKYISFEEARAFTRKLNLKSVAEWRDYCKCAILGANENPALQQNLWVNFGSGRSPSV
jgi:superfamily II DNA or RNA helicase